jgi:DNA-directed RNA polymerase alpha subunit
MPSSFIDARSLPRYQRIYAAALRDGVSAVAQAEGLTPNRIRQIVTRYRHHVARQQEQANARRQYQDNIREAPVGDVLELSARIERALLTAGIRTIGDLILHSPDDLLRHVRNLGRKSLRALVAALGPLGLSLRKRSATPRRTPVF